MRIAAVMATVDRGECNYIAQTIAGLKENGFFDYPELRLTVFDSGSESTDFLKGVDASGLPVSIQYSRKRLPLNRNVSRALRWGARSGADVVVLMEDDIEVAPNLAARIAALIARDADGTRVWSFHAAFGAVREAVARGADHWDLQCPGFYGSLCVAMRAVDAESFSRRLDDRLAGPEPVPPADLEINQWLVDTPGTDHVRCAAPCLVQHTGEHSSLRGVGAPFITNGTFRMNFDWLAEGDVPVLKEGLRMERAGRRYLLHGDKPGQSVRIDSSSLAVLQNCTGNASAGRIVDALARRFGVRRIVMREDVRAVLEAMEGFGFISRRRGCGH